VMTLGSVSNTPDAPRPTCDPSGIALPFPGLQPLHCAKQHAYGCFLQCPPALRQTAQFSGPRQ
jgi:hypothetical protein